MFRRVSLLSLVSMVAAIAVVIAIATSGSARAQGEPAPSAAPATAPEIPAHHADPGRVPDMNWVGENPDGDGPPAIFMFLNFAVFAGILIAFAGPALRRYMEARHTLIKGALDEASKIRGEAKAQLEEYSRRIADVDSEVSKLVADVRADAEAEKERIIEEGRQQAERMKREAESRIAAEFARARQEIEQEVVAAAISAATTLLRDKTSTSDKTALVDAFITDIDSADAAPGASPRGAS